MSFHNKNFWLNGESVSLNDGMMNVQTSSKFEQKRTHQWDIPVHEFFSNKKQAVESIIRPVQAENVDISLWNNPSSCQSVSAFTDQLFDPESVGTCDLSDKTTSCSDSNNMNVGRAGGSDQFGNNSSVNLAMSRDIEHSICGMGKVNGNLVRDSGGGFSESVVHMAGRPIDQQYRKEAGRFSSTVPGYGREHESIFLINHSYHKPAEMAIGTSFDKRDDNSNFMAMVPNYVEGQATTISFEAETSDASVRLLSSSDLLIRQSLEKPAETHTQDNLMEPNENQGASVASLSNIADGALINKEQKKKIPTNNFPANVKSMLSTGIFDGVPVKYVSWSREKNLHGVIKGTGYLCGCKDCNQTKALNAYEFERHAGGKTKHPNNHIFFENGKSVYAAVQELKSTPQEMLFEAIEKLTGSSINQKNFRIWKASYQAATRELERIYGKEEAAKLL
ncbi:OLC1v1027701C1 [Oldenlandia corymbosa var. corymbosa]|uniref:OLC1v1027701C1 n=1 Tax=Oldenlandia corymbosa var. corymbosa TaxID=529605 RepID=A0AAV1CAC5_OLDCO|nr:OLC1v1027701C1 [Oldenlandia corymbosa var. corymbosa]